MAKLLLLSALLLLLTSTAQAASVLGFPDKVTDGATFALCQGRACKMVHLCGVQAPQKGEPGYAASRLALITDLGNNLITCRDVGDGTPCDGRSKQMVNHLIVMQCFVNKHDVAAEMVHAGKDCDAIDMSGGYYSKDGAGKTCPASVEQATTHAD